MLLEALYGCRAHGDSAAGRSLGDPNVREGPPYTPLHAQGKAKPSILPHPRGEASSLPASRGQPSSSPQPPNLNQRHPKVFLFFF